MSFVQRERDRLATVLRANPRDNDYERLYAAQQAFAWAIEPTGFASPFDSIKGTPEDSAGCLADPRQLPS